MQSYTRWCLVLGLCATLAVWGTKARAQDTAEATDETGVSLESITEVRTLRCETFDKAKRASLKADAYASSAATMAYGAANRMAAEAQASTARGEADAAYTEAGRLKRQVESLVETFLAEHQVLLDATTDEAERSKIEATMAQVREIRDGGCS